MTASPANTYESISGKAVSWHAVDTTDEDQAIEAAVREFIPGGIATPAEYDKFYERFGNDTWIAERVYCRLAGADLASLPLPKWERELAGESLRANGDHFDFVLAPPADGIDGAFALGSVHILFGSSGTGKSTLGLQMLRAQAAQQPFFGHESFGRNYLYLMKDRGKHETARTFARLGIDESVPTASVLGGLDWRSAAESIKNRLLEHGQPEILFVEGLDMCLEDPSKPSLVGPFMDALSQIAETYHVSIIGTVGAPKLKKNEQYSPRDGMFGSSFWARKADTMVRVTQDDETGLREVILMYRNSAQERFTFQFTGRVMEPVEVTEPEPTDARAAVRDFLATQEDWVTSKTVQAALLMPRPTANRALEQPAIEKRQHTFPGQYRLKRS